MWDRPTGEGYHVREPRHRREGVEEDIQQETGTPASVSTATRARSNIILTDATEVANSYHDLSGFFSGFLRRVVQGVFFMNTWCLVTYRAHHTPGIRNGSYVNEKLNFFIYISTNMLRGRS